MKKKKSKLYYVIILLFIIFSSVYIISESGYYEYTLHGKTILTKEKMLEFEKDVRDNKDIDIMDYYIVDKKYSSKFTDGINNTSKDFVKLSRKIMKRIFKALNKYFSE